MVAIQDITERKLIEVALKKSMEFSETVFNSMNDAISIIDVNDFRLIDVNSFFLKSYALKKEDVIGKTCYEITHKRANPCNSPDDICPLLKTLETGKHSEAEHVHYTRDGEKQYVEVATSPIFDEKGKLINVIHVARDITEHKKSEELLSKLNKCFLNFVPEPLENINSLTKLCGELMGATCALYNRLDQGMLCSWGQWNTPQDYNSVDKPEGHICYDTINRGSDEVLVIHNLPETLYLRTDPNVRAYNLKTYIGKAVKFADDYVGSLCVVYQNDFSPSEDDKRLMGIITYAIAVEEKRKWDVEGLRKSEEKYRTLIDNASDAILIADVKGNLLEANRKAEQLLGYKKQELSNMNITQIHPEKEFEKSFGAFKEIIKNGSGCLIDAQILRKDGKTVPVDITGSLIEFEGKRVLLGLFRDITERKRAEQIFVENERLEAADQAKSEFLANMSHELRTPLNSSIGFSELLKEKTTGELSEKQKHYVDNILISNQFLLTLINDILDLSKIEAGKIELVSDKMSVSVVIRETLSLIKEKAMKHNVLLKTEFDPQIEFIEADKQRFKQILFNLLSNAVKFSKETGGTITITAKKEGDMAKVSVSDTGIGIKEENIGRLFQKFEQLESGIGKKYGGTGLGLAITKQLVELHGGKIQAESKYGEGSTFTFTLPIKAKNKNIKLLQRPMMHHPTSTEP